MLLSDATATPRASTAQVSPRQAIEIGSNVRTARGHEVVDLGFTNVSGQPATLLISLKNHLPLTRGEVLLNAPRETFRNGTITELLPANRTHPFYDLELTLPRGSAGSVEVDLVRDFGAQGTPHSQIAAIGFGP